MSNEDTKFSPYSIAIYRGQARVDAPPPGARVFILGSFVADDGKWHYNVCESKSSPSHTCCENELEPAQSIPWVSDEEIISNIVSQTAILRYSITSVGLRQLLEARGIAPMKCLLISSGQGVDVNQTLILPDGTIVNTDYREHRQTRQAWRFTDWQILSYSNREIELCHEIVSRNHREFDADVKSHYDTKFAATDHDLPPLQWGDRFWHALEVPPE